MLNLSILKSYAGKNPQEFPSSVLFSSTQSSLTVYDAYPKSIFHFLILPRILDEDDTLLLGNPHSLLNGDKQRAKDVLLDLSEDAKILKQRIEEEMMARYGFKWDVWMGFHGAPSMEHLHLHVLSADLCSDRVKNKKHYNSFHPKLGFFLHLEEVLSWFDAEPSFYTSKANLKPSSFEPLLKEDLSCFHCGNHMKNMPSLKAHLQMEWEKLEGESKRRDRNKRKLLEQVDGAADKSKDSDRDLQKKPRLEGDT